MNPCCCRMGSTSQVYFINNTNINYLRPSVCVQIGRVLDRGRRLSARNMASQPQEDQRDVDEKARQGETVAPGGTGGKNLEAQQHLAQGRSRGGQTRKDKLGSEGYEERGSKGGQARKEQMTREAYQELGHQGGLSSRRDKSGGGGPEEKGH